MGKLISLSLAVLLAACSGGSPESSINDDSLLSLSIDFQMRDKYSALVSDSFQPSSADDAAIAISKARQWLGNNYAEFQPTSGNFDPVEETLDCQEGSVLRAQKGFVFAPIYHFVFSDCKINSYTFSGEAEMSQSRFDCSGPSLFFRFQDTTIATQDSIVDITGSLSYVSGSLNCGSGAGGPPGEYRRVALDIQNLKTTSESETTHYNEITTTNNSQAPSLLHSDLRVSVTHTAKVEKNNTLQGVSIRLEEPLLISSSPEVAYTGRLTGSLNAARNS